MPAAKASAAELDVLQSEMPESRRWSGSRGGLEVEVWDSHLAFEMQRLFSAMFSAYTPWDKSNARWLREGRLCRGVVA